MTSPDDLSSEVSIDNSILSTNVISDFPLPDSLLPPFPPVVRKTILKSTDGEDLITAPSIGVLAGVYKLYIGQFKISELRGCWKHVVDERGCYYDVSLIVKYPTISDYAETVRNCMAGCGVATLLAAYVTGGSVLAAAQAAFVECTKACLLISIGTVAREFDLSFEDHKVRCSKWSRH